MNGLNRPSIFTRHSSAVGGHHKSAGSSSRRSDSESKSHQPPKRKITEISTTIWMQQSETSQTVHYTRRQRFKSHRSLKSKDVKSLEHRRSEPHQRLSISIVPTKDEVLLHLTKDETHEEEDVDICGCDDAVLVLPLETPDIRTIKPNAHISPLLLSSAPADKVSIRVRRLIEGLSLLFDSPRLLSISPKLPLKIRDKIERGFPLDHLGSLVVQETAYREGVITVCISADLDARLHAHLMRKKTVSNPKVVLPYWQTLSLIQEVCTIRHLPSTNNRYTVREIHFSEKVKDAIKDSLEGKTAPERFRFLAHFFKQIHLLIDPEKTIDTASKKVSPISLAKAVDRVTTQMQPSRLTD